MRIFHMVIIKLSILLISASLNLIYSQIQLPSLFSNNMVLQQNFKAPIWGWAKPNTKVSISVSWDSSDYEIEADENGKWSIKIETPSAGGPYSMQINEILIENIMIGEVWICSGQSNMQWALNQTEDSDTEIKTADYEDIRMFYVARDNSDCPNKDVVAKWEQCSPEIAGTFSAVAYYFGKELFNELNIPIGLIHTSWGGSTAQAWINHNVLESTPEGKFYIDRYQEKIENAPPGVNPRNHQSPSSLYNGMLSPLIPFSIKGAIWYQGESNTNEHYMYKNLMNSLISNWRTEWDQGDFPFYFVQLAPFKYQKEIIGAALRDAQRRSLEIPNTGMAIIMDIGNPEDIHPLNKREVGKRLSLLALAKSYGKDDLVYSGPLYKSMKIENNKIRIFFDHIGSGLICKGDKLSHFTIAGKNKEFVPAEAIIENNSILVSSNKVENPVAVRFAFNNGDEPNLFNKEDLPASTFRTDNWEIITEVPEIISDFDPVSKEIYVSMNSKAASEIRYTLDGSNPDLMSNKYLNPFIIEKDARIRAKAYINGAPSLLVSEANLEKHAAVGKKVIYGNEYNSKYPGGGKFGLVNSLAGSKDFNDGKWQGFLGKNLDIIIDLDKIIPISEIKINFLQNVNAWIMLPSSVEVYISNDGTNFKQIASKVNDVPTNDMLVRIKEFRFEFMNEAARFMKISAKNYGPLPQWHQGSGNESWLFADEVILN